MTIVGPMAYADGISRFSIGLIDTLYKDLKINFICSRGESAFNLAEVNKEVQSLALNQDKIPGKVALMLDGVWYKGLNTISYVPNSEIKIAYSMIETNKLPLVWASILNEQFDAVVVPDEYLKKIYEDSNVKKPIFCLPMGLYLEPLLSKPLKKIKVRNDIFIFGASGAICERKNHTTLIKAFAKAFGNNPKIQLKIHSRGGFPYLIKEMENLIKKLKLKNVELYIASLETHEYEDFLMSLDVYVSLSKGEGFSVGPRESLALGIPTILSNNTAHKTICQESFVLPIKSEILKDAFQDYILFFGVDCGQNYNVKIEDAVVGLKNMYANYEYFLIQMPQAKKWAAQYLYMNLKARYLSLLKPQKIFLGDKNIIEDDFLMTNSIDLYNKYRKILC